MKSAVKNLLNHISALGSKEITLLIPLFLFLINQNQLAIKIFLGITLCYILAIPIRLIYNKERPNPKPRNNLLQKIDANSFPSMHATRTTFLYGQLILFFNKIETTLFFLIIIFTIYYARIHKKRHDTSDIIAGVLLGIFVLFIIQKLI